MEQFKKPELRDKQWVNAIFNNDANQSCELCFGNIFMWSKVYDNLIVNYNDMFIAKNIFEKNNEYSVPMGKGDFLQALNFIISDAKNDNKVCKISGVTNSQIKEIEIAMPNKFEFTQERNLFDYIYSVERLSTLAGKKLHSKRNHITNFKKMNPTWEYELIDQSNINDCIEMHKKWIEINSTPETREGYDKEFLAMSVGFQNFFELDFLGGLIRLDGETVAFSFGEKINDNVFCTHFEKAYSTIRGAYPFINQLFAQKTIFNYKFVNREEDMGLEFLRKSKLSYHPDILLEKSVAVFRG